MKTDVVTLISEQMSSHEILLEIKLIIESFHQKDKTTINHTLLMTETQNKNKIGRTKQRINKSTIMTGVFNTPVSVN